MGGNHADGRGNGAPADPSRRKALLLGSVGIAGAMLHKGTTAAAAVAPPAARAAGQSRAGSGPARRVTVNGLGIEYEVIGVGEPVVVTPGGASRRTRRGCASWPRPSPAPAGRC